jgi:hypothetical protein
MPGYLRRNPAGYGGRGMAPTEFHLPGPGPRSGPHPLGEGRSLHLHEGGRLQGCG